MSGRLSAFALAAAVALVCLTARSASASPSLALDDRVNAELAHLQAIGTLPPYLGGLRPLTEARAQALRRAAGLPPDPLLVGAEVDHAWIAPVRTLRMRGILVRDRQRPYSTEVHPRDLAGGVVTSCEHMEGRACGNGAGLEWELDSALGYGPWLSAATRVRLVTGTDDHDTEALLDRAHAGVEVGPLAMQVGRDVLVIGPSARTQALWGDNAPPLDHVRLSMRPIAIAGEQGSILRASALWFLGRLRDPQTFDGTLVDGTRVQADLWNTVELGLTHLIQLGGDGAPDFTFGDYLLEHTQHNADGQEFANHRLAADVSVTIPRLAGLRAYYEVAAEDLRDEIGSMLARDADHVLGLELDHMTPRTALLVELTRTGVRSHEHHVFTTGTTNAGRIPGNPLGPGSTAAFAALRLDLDVLSATCGLELARQSSDTYFFASGPIVRTADLPDEWRFRSTGRVVVPVSPAVRVDFRSFGENIRTADFVPDRTRLNLGFEAVVIWTPSWRLVPGF
jgi:Capsule assembly protein Wzi